MLQLKVRVFGIDPNEQVNVTSAIMRPFKPDGKFVQLYIPATDGVEVTVDADIPVEHIMGSVREVYGSVWKALGTYAEISVEVWGANKNFPLELHTSKGGIYLSWLMDTHNWACVRRDKNGVLVYHMTSPDAVDGWLPVPGAPVIKDDVPAQPEARCPKARDIIDRLLAYVNQDAEDIRKMGGDEEVASIEKVIKDTEQYLSDNTPATQFMTEQELNTVLACVRHCQQFNVDLSDMDHFSGEPYGPLDWDQVDRLIEDKMYELCDGAEVSTVPNKGGGS